MVIILLLMLLIVICVYLGTTLGIYTAYKQMQNSLDDTLNKANSMFLDTVDKIKKSYNDLYADFKKMDEKRDNK